MPNTQVLLTADIIAPDWSWHQGTVVELFSRLDLAPESTSVMMCGPEPMLQAAADRLRELQVPDESIWVSLERNMQCGMGQCGFCQLGPKFVCSDGPVFCLADISPLLAVPGM